MPGAPDDSRDLALADGIAPRIGVRAGVIDKPFLLHLDEIIRDLLHFRAVHCDLAILVKIPEPALPHHRFEDAVAGVRLGITVHERPGLLLHELGGFVVIVPCLELRGDFIRIGRQAGLLEQVVSVEHYHRAAVPWHGVDFVVHGGVLPFVRHDFILVRRHTVGDVEQRVDLHHLREIRRFQRQHIRHRIIRIGGHQIFLIEVGGFHGLEFDVDIRIGFLEAVHVEIDSRFGLLPDPDDQLDLLSSSLLCPARA
ncbi:hypothetical protein D3C71_1472710 [compost metagenome]